MEQMGYNQNDLANIVGLKNASEILNRKRKLSLEMIRQLHEQLNIPTDVLIRIKLIEFIPIHNYNL
jgi:HTH-type transcriptional regulator/antitoxin HigA